MICLLVDTSHTHAFLALYQKKQKQISCLSKLEWSHDLISHSSYIVVAFDKALKEAKIIPSQIEALFLGIGPGRFTGLRVAFSFMKSLSYATNLPVRVCSSLRIWAEPYLKPGGPPVLVLINAFKNSVFVACFKKTQSKEVVELISPQTSSPKDLSFLLKREKKCICIGDGFFIYREHIPLSVKKKCIVKQGAVLLSQSFAQIIKECPQNLSKKNWDTLNPMYLKENFFKRFS